MGHFQDFCHLACLNEAKLIESTNLSKYCDFCGRCGSKRTWSNSLYEYRDKKVIVCLPCEDDVSDEINAIKSDYIIALILNRNICDSASLPLELHNYIISILIKAMLADVTDRWDNWCYFCEDVIASQD
jgi:hypothetical protein